MNEIWYGDQRTYDKIIRKALDYLTQLRKFAIELGTYTIKNCKIKLVEYGGHCVVVIMSEIVHLTIKLYSMILRVIEKQIISKHTKREE